jgi:hypothetical protein
MDARGEWALIIFTTPNHERATGLGMSSIGDQVEAKPYVFRVPAVQNVWLCLQQPFKYIDYIAYSHLQVDFSLCGRGRNIKECW